MAISSIVYRKAFQNYEPIFFIKHFIFSMPALLAPVKPEHINFSLYLQINFELFVLSILMAGMYFGYWFWHTVA
jgi:hypothetical protein